MCLKVKVESWVSWEGEGETHQETNRHNGPIRVLGDTVTESLGQIDILSVIAGVGALEE